MIRIGICDDEAEQIEKLKTCICNYYKRKDDFFDIETTTNGEEFLNDIYKFDVVFLDIEMSKKETMQGIRIGTKLRENRNLSIIYLTDYEQYMVNAMAAHCFEFRQKPITQEKVDYLLDEVAKFAKVNEAIIKIKDETINLKQVIYAKADNHTVVFHMQDNCIKKYNCKFEDVSERMKKEAEYFALIHRKYIINLKYVIKKGAEITMINGDSLPLARTREAELNRIYKKCIEKRII